MCDKKEIVKMKNYCIVGAGKRIDSFNTIRMFASWAVVLLHVYASWNNQYDTFWNSGSGHIVFDTVGIGLLTQWAVPVFFMMSGVLLLNPQKEISIKKIGKYIYRMIGVLLIIGFPYGLAKIVVFERDFNIKILYKAVTYLFLETDGIVYSFWYVYALIGLYLLSPLLKIFARNGSEEEQKFFSVILFVCLISIPTVNFFIENNVTDFGISSMSGALFYYWIGYRIAYGKKSNSINKKRIVFCGMVAALIFLMIQSFYGIKVQRAFHGPTYIWVAVFSICVFWLAIRSKKIAVLGGAESCSVLCRYQFFNLFST